ncbi:unnamed protein product [Sphagnum jensenii]|uniref:Uncharacterized protein n=1 Tax=Sphagnum jensenii TaxID=128206 RepID=A0ABP0XB23_9BRYO
MRPRLSLCGKAEIASSQENIQRWEKDLNVLGAHMASKKGADAHWAAENPGVPDPKPAFQQVISNKALSTFQMMMSSQILLPSMILMARIHRSDSESNSAAIYDPDGEELEE